MGSAFSIWNAYEFGELSIIIELFISLPINARSFMNMEEFHTDQCSLNSLNFQKLFGSSFSIKGSAYFDSDAVKITTSNILLASSRKYFAPGLTWT